MSWMNASAMAALDRRNAELSSWDHSKESPDGMGRRDANDFGGGGTAPPAAAPAPWPSAEEMAAASVTARAEEEAIIAGMMAERDEMDR